MSQVAQIFCPNCKGGNPPAAVQCMWCHMRLVPNQPSATTARKKRPMWQWLAGGAVGLSVLAGLASATPPNAAQLTRAAKTSSATQVVRSKSQPTARVDTRATARVATASARNQDKKVFSTGTAEAILVVRATQTAFAPLAAETAKAEQATVIAGAQITSEAYKQQAQANAAVESRKQVVTATAHALEAVYATRVAASALPRRAAPTAVPKSASTGERCGAVCSDGSSSNATGSGACSRHGGVDHWVTCQLLSP